MRTSETAARPAAPESDGPAGLRLRPAAKFVGVSERTLWGWTKAGKVPCKKVGRVVLYSADALRAWLAGGPAV